MQLTAAVANALDTAADQYGLPRPFVYAVAKVESAFNPAAVSPVGAMGLMQLMPRTAAGLGVADPFDAYQSAIAGARMLRGLIEKFGNYAAALAAYNWGPARVEKKPDPALWPGQVQNYVRHVFAAMAAIAGSNVVFPMEVRNAPAGAAAGGALALIAAAWMLSRRTRQHRRAS